MRESALPFGLAPTVESPRVVAIDRTSIGVDRITVGRDEATKSRDAEERRAAIVGDDGLAIFTGFCEYL